MTCPVCQQMCSTSEKQHAIRMKNIALHPQAQPMPCPQCQGQDWATTREMIKPEPPQPSWWRRTPTWRGVMYMNWGLLGFSVGNGLFTSEVYLQIINAFLAGFALACGANAWRMIKIDADLKRLRDQFDELRYGGMEHHIEVSVVEHDDPPLAPRLH